MYCSRCKENKDSQFFSKSKFNKSGFRTHCKACGILDTNAWRTKNKTKDKEAKKAYYEKNKKQIKNWIREYNKTRRHNDINFRILVNLRRRLNNAINRHSKSKSTLELLGVGIPGLRLHLESQFQSGMSWDNYGKWHIDHIKPCSSFDLSSKEEQQACFNYKNLQPLWAKDNLQKSASVPIPTS